MGFGMGTTKREGKNRISKMGGGVWYMYQSKGVWIQEYSLKGRRNFSQPYKAQ